MTERLTTMRMRVSKMVADLNSEAVFQFRTTCLVYTVYALYTAVGIQQIYIIKGAFKGTFCATKIW